MIVNERTSLWARVLYGLFLCVLVPVYGHYYGAANFLWASDIALLFVCAASWTEKPLPNSLMPRKGPRSSVGA